MIRERSPLIKKEDSKGRTVYFKCDYMLPSGSFKYREALIVNELQSIFNFDTVICASSGNTSHALSMVLSNARVISFIWGKELNRIEAIGKAFRAYEEKNPARTLLFAGSKHPIKILAHQMMAREVLAQTDQHNLTTTHYFQATGSGYGCDAMDAVSRNIAAVRVRPERKFDPSLWAPALSDPPPMAELVLVSGDEIRRAWERLQKILPNDAKTRPGLEGAVALAGWEHWAELSPIAAARAIPVVNITGILRGELPW